MKLREQLLRRYRRRTRCGWGILIVTSYVLLLTLAKMLYHPDTGDAFNAMYAPVNKVVVAIYNYVPAARLLWRFIPAFPFRGVSDAIGSAVLFAGYLSGARLSWLGEQDKRELDDSDMRVFREKLDREAYPKDR